MDDQVRQAKANLQQVQAAVEQALANYQQGKSDMELARITAERWNNLVTRGVVSRQDNDQYQAQYQSKLASLNALEKAIAAQRSNVSAAEASVANLERMQSYLLVKAPFAGVITLRNVDVGALVNAGNTMLLRIAQTATLRTYVNVPQSHANSVRPGQAAQVSVSNLPGRHFIGTVVRTANSLDPASRTLLVEVHVPNPDGSLFPGMYAQVDLSSARANPPLLVPSDALIADAGGTSIAVVRPDHTVHLQKIEIGRDYGDRLEITNGLQEGDTIIPNPGDAAREGLKVAPVPISGK
jgi:RND family efflux transporter MFP subunit